MLDQIKADIKTSLLAGDRFRVDALKMAQAALMNARIAKGVEAQLSDEECIQVVQKEIKKRKEAADMYAAAGLEERAQKERDEMAILEAYVPKMLTGDELEAALTGLLDNLGTMTFPEAMQTAIKELGNVDKAALATMLKAKLK